jgi:hypothetical protein
MCDCDVTVLSVAAAGLTFPSSPLSVLYRYFKIVDEH